MPVVLGGGKKLFADGSAPHSYTLTRSRVSTTGLVIAHYERTGDARSDRNGNSDRYGAESRMTLLDRKVRSGLAYHRIRKRQGVAAEFGMQPMTAGRPDFHIETESSSWGRLPAAHGG